MKSHGHVTPNEDGSVARCGGPSICSVCAKELAALNKSKIQSFERVSKVMSKIFREELKLVDYQEITSDAIPLAVDPGRTHNGIDIWTIHHNGKSEEKRGIYIVGTGNPMPDGLSAFIGTCVMPNGLVWHVFEGEVQ